MLQFTFQNLIHGRRICDTAFRSSTRIILISGRKMASQTSFLLTPLKNHGSSSIAKNGKQRHAGG